MNDIDDVLLQARDALSGARMEIPVEAILAKGRSRRHRRRLVQLSAAGVAASGCLALGLAAVVGSGRPAPVPGTIRTAAFTLARNANGTASLKLNQDQTFDPAALQQALARDGIPALVHIGIFCKSTPAPPSSGAVSRNCSTRWLTRSRSPAPARPTSRQASRKPEPGLENAIYLGVSGLAEMG